MTTVLIVCAIVITVAIVVAVVYLVMTLSQIKKTAHEAQVLLVNINQEISTIGRITGNVSAFIERLTSPWVRMGGWVGAVVSSLIGKRKGSVPSRDENDAEREKAGAF